MTLEFRCYGSMEQIKVTAAFERLLPRWKAVDLQETERLKNARMQRTEEIASEVDFLKILGHWPAINRYGMGGLPFELPNCVVQLHTIFPLFRAVEDLVIESLTSAVLVYWSTSSATQLLPSGATFRSLLKEGSCVSIFSEDDDLTTEEWCFLVESSELSLFVYGKEENANQIYSPHNRIGTRSEDTNPH